MKELLFLAVIVSAAGFWQPALAQVPTGRPAATGATQLDAAGPNAPPTEWRLAPARHATPTGPGHLKEATGVLISDPQGRQIRFEAKGRVEFVVPYERINALHYEEWGYPQRFLKRSSFYLTIHYSDAAGRPAFESIRLVSRPDALSALDALERDTGRTFDRAAATRSFTGIPIRAGIGARVAVTDQTGQTTKGVITQLSASSLALGESGGIARVFDETSLRTIRLLYSPKHEALPGLLAGAVTGALLGSWLMAGGGDASEVVGGAALCAGLVGGSWAAIDLTISAFRYPSNDAYDVYRTVGRPVFRSVITMTPQVTQARKGVLVSVSF